MIKGPDPDDELLKLISKQRKVYDRIGILDCPIIRNKVRFNIAGFRHLHTDGKGKYRTKERATSRLLLLQYAPDVIKYCNMLKTNRYAAEETPSGKPETYYNLYAKVGPRKVKVRVVVRTIGGGKPHFYGIRRD